MLYIIYYCINTHTLFKWVVDWICKLSLQYKTNSSGSDIFMIFFLYTYAF